MTIDRSPPPRRSARMQRRFARIVQLSVAVMKVALLLSLLFLAGAHADYATYCGDGHLFHLKFAGLPAAGQPAALAATHQALAPNASTTYPLGLTLLSSWTVVLGVNISAAPPSHGRTLLQVPANSSSSSDAVSGGTEGSFPLPASPPLTAASASLPPAPGSWGDAGAADGVHNGDWRGRDGQWWSRCTNWIGARRDAALL